MTTNTTALHNLMLLRSSMVFPLFRSLSGEVKLLVDPEAHQQQFERFLQKCGDVAEHEG